MNRLFFAALGGPTVEGETLPGATFFPESTSEHIALRQALGISDDNAYHVYALCSAVMAHADLYSTTGERGHTWDARMTGRRLWAISDGVTLVPNSEGKAHVRRRATEWPTEIFIQAEWDDPVLTLRLGRKTWKVTTQPHPETAGVTQVAWPEELGIAGDLQDIAGSFQIRHNPVSVAWGEGAARLKSAVAAYQGVLQRQRLMSAFNLAEDDIRAVAVAVTALAKDVRVAVEGQ